MSRGGRGGSAIHVTTLADHGPGSLRAAVEANGPRTVIFDIGGTIRLERPLVVRNGRITIAGQTAPGGGVTLRDYGLTILADDVVVRFIRSRMGDTSRAVGDAVWVANGRRVILDHVSASWSNDETLSIASSFSRSGDRLGDVTVQWSIISESLCRGPQGLHCYGSLVSASRGARISFHHNLWASHAGRMPRPANMLAPGQDREGAFLEFRSNVFYNWGGRQAGYDSGPGGILNLNLVDNSYWPGPDSKGELIYENRNPFAHAWVTGNAFNGQVPADDWAHVLSRTPGFRLARPVAVASVVPDPANTAYERVLAHAGASLLRDSVDRRVIEGVRSRTGGLIGSQAQVGGWPALERGSPWRDSDGDGLPDEWEREHKLDAGDRRDGARDSDGDGYTNLEEWLNALAAPAMA